MIEKREGEIEALIIALDIEKHPDCDLFHEQEFKEKNTTAVIKIPFGFNRQKTDDLVLGLCERCYSRLQDDNWLLLYCYECNNSRWIDKRYSKLQYRKETEIIWLRGCPECSNKFGAAYFTNKPIEESKDVKEKTEKD